MHGCVSFQMMNAFLNIFIIDVKTQNSGFSKNQLGSYLALVKQVLADPETAPVSNKLKALLRITAKVQAGGKNEMPEDIDRARITGATDIEIHESN